MFIFDGHLDLAMNAMEWNRDLRLPLDQINTREEGLTDKPDRGKANVSLPAMRQGRIAICMATQIARYVDLKNTLPGWYSQEQAWAQTQAQLAWYQEMVRQGEMRQITDLNSLQDHIAEWEKGSLSAPIGFILSLEGADSIVSMEHLEKAHADGLRAVGPAHYGPGVYAKGTHAIGGIGEKGRELLTHMERLNIILDATHLSDESFWEALEHFQGPVWSSHTNSRKLVPDQRQFTDDQYKALMERHSVLGVAMDAWMLVPNWERGISTPENTDVSLAHVANQIDYICQLAGNADYAAIGSDLDGAFGKEQAPGDLDSIADLQKLKPLLEEKGYSKNDIEKIFWKNWIHFLERAWG